MEYCDVGLGKLSSKKIRGDASHYDSTAKEKSAEKRTTINVENSGTAPHWNDHPR